MDYSVTLIPSSLSIFVQLISLAVLIFLVYVAVRGIKAFNTFRQEKQK